MLERRAAAAVRAWNAAQRRVESAATLERDRATAIREWMRSQSSWTSDLCSIVERRAERTHGSLDDLARHKVRARRAAEAHEDDRRRWARVVRGLERRLARAAEQEQTWRD